jgi:hypothetical protein
MEKGPAWRGIKSQKASGVLSSAEMGMTYNGYF